MSNNLRIKKSRYLTGPLRSLLIGLALTILCLWFLRESTMTPYSVQAMEIPEKLVALPTTGTMPLSPYNPWISAESDITRAIAWGDIDGDGDLDLAVGNFDGRNEIYLNENGILSEQATWFSNDADDTNSIAWGDVDGDGDLDLAVGNGDNDLWGGYNKLYLNENGQLQATAAWVSDDDDITLSVAWGDVDGDGDLDLAVGNNEAFFSWSSTAANKIYLNQNGMLQTTAAWVSDDTNETWSVAWGDVDGDGDLDLAIGNGNDDWETVSILKIYMNEGGSLQTSASWEAVDLIGHYVVYSVAWGDVDGDGDLDLAVGRWGENLLYLNEGGKLQTTTSWISGVGDESHTSSVAWGDVDGDGDLDLAAGNGFNLGFQSSKVYLNDRGTLQTEADNPWVPLGEYVAVGAVAWGDVDGDGDLDLATGVGETYGGQNKIYINQGSALQASAEYTLPFSDTVDIALGDVDGDGDLDLAVTNSDEPTKIYRYQDGNFQTTPSWVSDDDGSSVAWGDADGDGDLDLATTAAQIYFNEGGVLQTNAGWASDSDGWVSKPLWGDINGDGYLDLVVREGSGGVGVYLNVDGTLQTTPGQVLIAAGVLALGDIDGDGDLDLVAGARVYINIDGNFQTTPSWVPDDGGVSSVALGDIDGDGSLDLVGGGFGQENRLYLNRGGTLETIASWTSGDTEYTKDIALEDIDGDGDLDLIVANGNAHGFNAGGQNKIYFNQGGNFQTAGDNPWLSNEADKTTSIDLGDIDGDGDIDLVVGNYDGDYTKVYLNGQRESQLPNNPPFLLVSRPKTNFYAPPLLITNTIIPISYTLLDLEGGIVGQVKGQYSLNGGGKWQPAIATSNTITTGLYPSFQDDLETGTTNWFTSGISPTWTLTQNNAYSGHSWFANNVDFITDQYLEMNQSFLVGEQSLLSFWHLYDTETGFDGGIVEISVDNGSWIDLEPYFVQNGYNETIRTNYNSPIAGQSAFSGNSGIFIETIADLDTFNGSFIRVRFRLATDSLTSANGWYVDNIHISNSHVFYWDTFASGFFGRSNNVVMRFVAIPQSPVGDVGNNYTYPNNVPGLFQRAYTSHATYPFQVRGTQTRVLTGTQPAANAIVYHLTESDNVATAISNPLTNQVWRTDQNGYLQGYGEVRPGDQLMALYPISDPITLGITFTNKISTYYTSAPATIRGLEMITVTQPGVQELVVSSDNPLILFNLDMALEWDARNDPEFLDNLDNALKLASEVLFDASNGQMALGDVRVTLNKENWLGADVVLFASSSVRPMANIGGVVNESTPDIGVTGVLTDAFTPGQVRLGPSWDPYGISTVDLGQDWQQALAHELSHYLLFLPDNYIGIQNGNLIDIDCVGSMMTSEDYSEFLRPDEWTGDCLNTVAAQETGRSDWETVTNFYPWLDGKAGATQLNSGPASLPLAVTQMTLIEPAEASAVLSTRFFDVRAGEGVQELLLLPRAEGYLHKTNGSLLDESDDRIIQLGKTGGGGDRLHVRGAEVGDRVCINDTSSGRYGCVTVTADNSSVYLYLLPDWQADIESTPVTSRTMAITVTMPVNVPALTLQVIPAYGAEATPDVVTATVATMSTTDGGLTWSETITLPHPAFEGIIRVYVPGATPEQETIAAYTLNSAFWGGSRRGWGGSRRGWGGSRRGWGAPISSGDGQVTVFNADDPFGSNGISSLQALPTLPNLPSWLTPVGKGYRVLQEASYDPQGDQRYISFNYLESQVPPGYEYALHIYHTVDGQAWQRLDTRIDDLQNMATAVLVDEANGSYALVVTVDIAPFDTGWNNFGYPIPETNPITTTLASIEGKYTMVAHFDGVEWLTYDPAVVLQHPQFVPTVNTLANFQFTEAYWLNATESVTLSVGVPGSNVQSGNLMNTLSLPPAVYFGWVLDGDITPTVGDTVEALIDGAVCGTATIFELDGNLAYRVNVLSETFFGNPNGCGTDDAIVSFRVDGQQLSNTASWENSMAWYLPLTTTVMDIYLPLIVNK